MADKPKKGSGTRSRSAITGKFVKSSTASRHPKTTVTEKVRKKSGGSGTTGTGPGKSEKK